jgi:hypothetical protein
MPASMRTGEVDRRTFLRRAGLLGLAAALAELPALLDARGLLETAAAQGADVTTDTLSGLVAFSLPGDDAYSRAQGESHPGPGGIAAGAVGALVESLDQYIPAAAFGGRENAVPASAGVAAALNDYALAVNPAAAAGAFASPFARLTFREKVEALHRFEADPLTENTELRFVGSVLPSFAAFLAFSEAAVWNPLTRTLSGRAVGWDITGYAGPAEGHPELRGYWKRRKRARPSKTRRRPGRPRAER